MEAFRPTHSSPQSDELDIAEAADAVFSPPVFAPIHQDVRGVEQVLSEFGGERFEDSTLSSDAVEEDELEVSTLPFPAACEFLPAPAHPPEWPSSLQQGADATEQQWNADSLYDAIVQRFLQDLPLLMPPQVVSAAGGGAGMVSLGRTVLVDAVFGADSTAAREDVRRPFRSISAAIAAAISGDVVLVLAGTYDELVVCKSGVSVVGIDEARCILSRAAAVSETVVTMAGSMEFSHFTIQAMPSAGVTTGLLFPGSTNATSVARVLTIKTLGGAGVFAPVELAGTAVPTIAHVCLETVRGSASGLSSGLVQSGTGTHQIRDCVFNGVTGLSVNAGIAILLDVRINGFIALNVVAGATVHVNSGTSYNNLANAGTLLKLAQSIAQRSVSVQNTATTAIDAVTPTTLLALPTLFACANAVKIAATLELQNASGAARLVSFRLYRDGVELSATDRYNERLQVADDNITFHAQWYDAAPSGTAAHIYSIRALADVVGVNRVNNSRATAWV